MNTKEIKSNIEIERELASYEGEDRIISSHEMRKMLETYDHGKEYGLLTFPELTEIIGGFVPGELITVSGLTGEGKTLLTQSFTSDFFSQDINSLWFSYEVTPKYFLKRFGMVLPIFYMPAVLSGNALSWLEKRIIEGIVKYDCKIVFIDHLHYIIDMRSRNNMSLEIGSVMRALKRYAVKHNIVIFLVAHLSKVKSDTEPDNQDLRDSSFIAQESDTVLIIWRNLSSESSSFLKVAKNRKLGKRSRINIIKSNTHLREEQI